jgi:hypothetical protein
MSIDKSLYEEVKSLKVKLDDLERQEYGQKIEALQRSNHVLKRAHQVKTEELQKANHKLAVRLGMLQGIAAVLVAVSSGVAVHYINQYQTEVDRNNEIVAQQPQVEVMQVEAYEVLIGMLQDKLGDTLDRISLFAPREEDKTMVMEVDELRQRLGRRDIESEKFDALSELINALKLIVNEGKGKEASALLDKKALTINKDRFVASRALVLQAMTLIQVNRQCDDPERTIGLVERAIQKDSGGIAAFNLLGVCLAEESRALMYKQPEYWQRSGETIHAALRNSEFAYQFKPTQWSRARFLNNKVWETSEYLLAALTQNKLNESLPWTGYKTLDEFFDQSVKDMEECQLLDPRQSSYLETLAELHGLECAFYRSPYHKDGRKAEEAYKKMIQALTGAINKGLLRKINEPDEAEKYFSGDDLLAPLFADPENPRTLEPRIKALIAQRLRFH